MKGNSGQSRANRGGLFQLAVVFILGTALSLAWMAIAVVVAQWVVP
jgi:hypothetical protein